MANACHLGSLNPIQQVLPSSIFQKKVMKHQDILFNIFMYLAVDAKQIAILSLINKTWSKVAKSPFLWEKICSLHDVIVPYDLHKAYDAYRCAQTSNFLEQARQCVKPKIVTIDLKVELAGCDLHFGQDRYVAVYREFKATVIRLSDGEITNHIETDSKIYDLCISQKIIFMSLENRKIEARSLESKNILFKMEGHIEDDFSKDEVVDVTIKLCANDRWLISHSAKMIKQWDIATGVCVASSHLNTDSSFLICRDELYETFYDDYDGTVAMRYTNLNNCNLDFSMPEFLQSSLGATSPIFSIDKNSFSYLNGIENSCEDLENSEDSNSEDSKSEEKLLTSHLRIASYFFNKKEWAFFTTKSYLSCKQTCFQTINSLAIVAPMFMDGEGIELIDLKTKETLQFVQMQQEMHYNNDWSLSFFHDTILYATYTNQIVKITFPEGPKRKSNTTGDERSAKKLKTSHQF